MRLWLLLLLLKTCRSQICGCPVGYYGGFFPGAQPSRILSHDGSDWRINTRSAGTSNGVRGCTGHMRLCKSSGSPCAEYNNDWSSAGTVRGVSSLGHATCQFDYGWADGSCDWNKMIASLVFRVQLALTIHQHTQNP
jgi:hypothetical protein